MPHVELLPPTVPVEVSPEPVIPNAVQRVLIPGSDLSKHDVVQIADQGSRTHGMFFMVGDVFRTKVHGYYILEGSKKEFITVDRDKVVIIGPSKVRAEKSCSDKWISDHRS